MEYESVCATGLSTLVIVNYGGPLDIIKTKVIRASGHTDVSASEINSKTL